HLLAKENPSDSALRRFIREIGKDMKALFILAKSDLTSRNPKKVRDALERLSKLEERIKEINKKDKISSFKLAINGFDIMEIFKIPPSKKVGIIKEHLENLVIEKQLPNRKRFLRKYLIENAEKIKNLDILQT
ncbi:MAG: tRNA nucleotidyltransferase, partial [Candidatus Omnitrophica bacterium]|nr:tRNA nucleotidyltransferase [Candidatus Omnitrophota bacterium]